MAFLINQPAGAAARRRRVSQFISETCARVRVRVHSSETVQSHEIQRPLYRHSNPFIARGVRFFYRVDVCRCHVIPRRQCAEPAAITGVFN